MATITFKGTPIETAGTLPAVGSKAPDFTLTNTELKNVGLGDYPGPRLLNIFPSVDTGVCAASVRSFNARAAQMPGVTVLNVSADLPFAHSRFCAAEGLEGVVSLATFRGRFLDDYGVTMTGGPLAGLASRAVVLVDADGVVRYVEQVPEIGQEPDYDAALAAIAALG